MKRAAMSMLLAATVWTAASAQADLWTDVLYGLNVLATPSGSPVFTSGDGTRVNGQRSGRLRIVPDRVGRGYSLEFDRSFGRDSRGRPEVLDLGMFELELQGPMQATLGYTNRGFLIGNGDFRINNLNYTLRAKSGVEDVELTGVLTGDGAFELNQLGFYELRLDVSNSADLFVDGVLATDQTDANFDIGPISVKGNIFFDAFVALLGALGVDTTPLEQIFPRSPIDRIVDELQNRLDLPTFVAGAQFTSDGQLPPVPGAWSAGATVAGQAYIPEPNALLLLAAGALALLRRR